SDAGRGDERARIFAYLTRFRIHLARVFTNLSRTITATSRSLEEDVHVEDVASSAKVSSIPPGVPKIRATRQVLRELRQIAGPYCHRRWSVRAEKGIAGPGPGHGPVMFSELCRETLRKAAVCYSSGRSSASPSPSPPTSPSISPPSSPQRQQPRQHQPDPTWPYKPYEPRVGDPQQTHFSRRERKRPAAPTNVSSRRTSGLESRDGRRLPYALAFDSNHNEAQNQHRIISTRHRQQQQQQSQRRGRSASPEMMRCGFDEQNRPQQQRARQRKSSPESDDNSSGDEAGTASDDNTQRPGSAHNRHSLTKGRESSSGVGPGLGIVGSNNGLLPGSGTSPSAKDIDRARLVRERQNEERQRKLEELRQQALAAQRFREQREEERRRRIEELRSRDNDRRSQVEERKRQLWEAERERREAIMRKNQERDARLEAKRKNERSQIVFAFGSSTPRMLEPADTGGASYWGTRRATSTTNVMMFSSTSAAQPLTRRSSERELDAGSKKRATSAGGLDRKPGEGEDSDAMAYGSTATTPTMPAAGCPTARFANRRRTDLIPTLPSPRDGCLSTSVYSTLSGRSSSAGKPFSRSPGRTYSMSRLDQLAQPRRRTAPPALADPHQLQTTPQQQQQSLASSSMSRSMSHLAHSRGPRHQQRDQSGLMHGPLKRNDNSRSMGTLHGLGLTLSLVAAASSPRQTRAERLRRKAREHAQQQQQAQHQMSQYLGVSSGVRSGEVTPSSPSRPPSSMSQQSATSSVASSSVNLRPRSGTPRRPRPASIAGTGVSTSINYSSEAKTPKDSKPPLPKSSGPGSATKKPSTPGSVGPAKQSPKPALGSSRSARASPRVTPRATPLQSPAVEHVPLVTIASEPIKEPKLPAPAIKPEGADKQTPSDSSNDAVQMTKDSSASSVEVCSTTLEESKLSAAVQPSSEEKVAIEAVAATVAQSAKEESDLIEEFVQPQPSAQQQAQASVVAVATSPVVAVASDLAENKDEPNKSVVAAAESEAKGEAEFDEQCDMTASMIQKIRITTEEEAKAALAERRRLAREQAEREAELERQRL
ncbi:hypothetical protein QAD02_006991, partial [Eretmocerus hayati]